jgi:hypothetical protein
MGLAKESAAFNQFGTSGNARNVKYSLKIFSAADTQISLCSIAQK